MKNINKENIKKILPSKKYLLISLTIALLVLVIYYKNEKPSIENTVTINGETVSVKIADTKTEQAKGLMFKKNLDENEGMLFVFDSERRHSFWMKNTLIPLDMIWVNSNKEVVHIEHSAPPCKESPCPTYSSDQPAQYVLELNGGWSIRHNLNLGDTLVF